MNGMFFEAGAALCWRGGAGAWSDAEGWYDVVTGRTGTWTDGRIAVFTDASDVTNDCAGVEVRGFVLHGDVTLRGEEIHLADCFMDVPSNRTVSISAPISSTNDFVKAGTGSLTLCGAQALTGGIAVRAGVLGLDGVTAPLVTNIAADVGSRLALRGDSFFARATAHASIAAGALCRMADEPASLELEDFLPANRFVLPEGITVRAASAYGLWKMTVNGCLECRTPPAMCINSWIDGTGTVRTAGLWTDTTSYARFSFCRVEMVPGAFQVLGNPGTGIMRRQYKNFLFDGVTFAPVGGDVHVTNSDLQEGLVTMCVNTNGVVFDTFDAAAGVGCTVSFDDPCATNLFFYGPGDVTKVGAGAVRFTVNDDLHEGRTIVQGGTYAVSTWSLTSGFHVTGEGATVELSGVAYEGDVSLGSGSVLDLSAPAVTMVVTTNLQLAADAVLKVCVTPDGCDLIDVSEGECDLPINGEVVLDVTVQTGTPPGLYAAVAFPSAVAGRWTGRFTAPGGQQAGLEFTADRKVLCVRVRRVATMLYIR
jgi:autotransporter-associated beta strand protein